MGRDMTAAFEAELSADKIIPIWLVEASFDSGTLYLWSGSGELSWNGQTWLGAPTLGAFGSITETSDMKVSGVDIVLNGLDTTVISLALGEDVKYRNAKLRLGFLDSNLDIILDPIPILSGDMQYFTIKRSDTTAVVALRIESRLVRSQVPRTRKYNPFDQQRFYPTDLGFNFVSLIQDRKPRWRS